MRTLLVVPLMLLAGCATMATTSGWDVQQQLRQADMAAQQAQQAALLAGMQADQDAAASMQMQIESTQTLMQMAPQ